MTTEGISSIGSYGGLNTSGMYGSYYDPSMIAAMGGYGSYGMSNPMMSGIGMAGGLGMMGGMYNPAFMGQYTDMMKQMYSAQNEIQKLNLQNATDMHAAKEQAQVYNAQIHDKAFFETVAVNGDVQNCIREIYSAIREGKMDYVAQKYFELKQVLLNKRRDYFDTSLGGINDKENIDHIISTLYSEIAAGYNPGGGKPDLREDILSYGESPFQHGFNQTFMGNSGHNRLTAEECLNQIYGTPINDAGSKAKAHKIGSISGSVTEVAAAGAAGAAVGATALGLTKIFTPSILTKYIPDAIATNGVVKWGTKFGTWAKAGAAALAIGDVLWQLSRA